MKDCSAFFPAAKLSFIVRFLIHGDGDLPFFFNVGAERIIFPDCFSFAFHTMYSCRALCIVALPWDSWGWDRSYVLVLVQAEKKNASVL